MIFDARYIARGWLTVALASAGDRQLSALNRTVHVEQHAHGVRLVATDSYVLLHCWVPDVEHDLSDQPDLDEAPISFGTAMDPHGRAKGFLAHALKLALAAEKAGGDDIDVRLRLNVAGAADKPAPGLPGLEALSVVIEMPDVERVVLTSYEGKYPGWRSALGDMRPVDTRLLALNPEILGRLCKVSRFHPQALLGWTFGGESRATRVEILQSEPPAEGLVMPVRWDFDRNAPRLDDPNDDAEGDDGQVDDEPDVAVGEGA